MGSQMCHLLSQKKLKQSNIYRNHDILWKITSEKNIISTISSILSSPKLLPKQCIHQSLTRWQLLLHQYGISVVSAQTVLSQNVPSGRERWESAVLQPNEQNSNYYLQNRTSLLVLVDSGLKRCRDFSLVKPRSDQWYGFRSGKCHSFFKIQIKISRLKAFTWVEMSEIPFTGLCHL